MAPFDPAAHLRMLREISVVPLSRDATALKIVPLPKADLLQKRVYKSWLGAAWKPSARPPR